MSNYHNKLQESPFNLLSEDLIVDILTRIPSKSVCRIKSVSKRFNSIISDPRFLPSYVSRVSLPSSWVILDRLPQLAPELTHPTRFQLIDRPKISNFAVNPRTLMSDLTTNPARSYSPNQILQFSNGLILFSLLNDLNLLGENPNLDAYILEDDMLFVVNPISNECVGVPGPERFISKGRNVGFSARVDPETGLVGRFLMVGYEPMIHCFGSFFCFGSDTGKWVEKRANCMLGLRKGRPDGAFELEGKLFWVDLTIGLITWDVDGNDYFRELENKEMAVCRLIPLPDGKEKPHDTRGLEDERYVGVGGGFVQFMELFKEEHCVLKLWRLKNCEVGGDWSLMYNVSSENVERFLTYKSCSCCGGGGMPKTCFIHPFEADVVYFETGDLIFSFDFRTRKVGTVDLFTPHKHVLPYVLPKWPSPIPKRLCMSPGHESGPERTACGITGMDIEGN